MIEKIEFSDINKFMASLGLICIGLAFFLPWFFNHDVSILLLKQSELKELTPTAKTIVETQQNTLQIVNNVLPWISLILIITGITLLVYSILRWKRRQNVLDKIQDEELKFREIQNLTSQEKRDLIENELVSENDDENISESERKNVIDKYIYLENLIYKKLSNSFKTSHVPNQNIRIGDYNYDIILKSRDFTMNADRIVEIKLYNQQLTFELLNDPINRLIRISKDYRSKFKRTTKVFLIVVYEHNEFDENLKLLRRKLMDYTQSEGVMLRVSFIPKSMIEDLDGRAILMGAVK